MSSHASPLLPRHKARPLIVSVVAFLVGLGALDLVPPPQSRSTLTTATTVGREALSSADPKPKTPPPQQQQRPHDPSTPIRYLAMGTSVTYGANIKEPYATLLGAPNLGTPGSGPKAILPCLASAVGDEAYDAIVIEYNERVTDPNRLRNFVQKLRNRFPDAVLVFIRDWFPMGASAKVDGKVMNMQDWLKKMDLKYSIWDKKFQQSFKEAVLNSPDVKWSWPEPEGGIKSWDKVIAKVGGHVLYLPRPPSVREMWTPVPDWDGYQYADFIQIDLKHWTDVGHAFMADRIRELVEPLPRVPNPRLTDWGPSNVCNRWHTQPDNTPAHSDNLELVMYRPGKYGLEFPREGGSITLFNPKQEALKLYVEVLVTGPPPSKYPAAKVTVENKASGKSPETCVLEQPNKTLFSWNYHVPIFTPVGTAYPGENILHFAPLEEQEISFRVTSTMMTIPKGEPWSMDLCRKPTKEELQAPSLA